MKKRSSSRTRARKTRARPWSDEDIIVFRKIYPYVQNSYLSEHFNRSLDGIRKKAIKLGLKKDWSGGYSQPVPPPENPWTKNQTKTLRQMYPGHTTNEISRQLGRTPAAVQSKIRDIGLTLNPKINLWKENETEFIRNNCKKMTLAQMAARLGRTKKAVYAKLQRLRQFEPQLRPAREKINWTDEEDILLEEYFFKWPIEKIAKKLKRPVRGVKSRAWKLYLFKQYRWTDAEEKKLEELLPKYSFDQIAVKLGRGIEAVIAKKKRLGLRKRRPWTSKELAVLRKFYPTESLRKLAKRLGKSPNAVANQALKLKLRKHKAKKRSRKKKK